MKSRYAMTREGRAFIDDGISLSWPQGGQRDVIELDDKDLPERFKIRVATGSIEMVDLEPTKASVIELPYELYEGEDAREIMKKPADPVILRRRRPDGTIRETELKPYEQITRPTAVKTQVTPVAKTSLSRRR